MASPQSLPMLSSQSTEAPTTRSRIRSQTIGSMAPKRTLKEYPVDKFGLKVSKDKLLLVKARAPDYYQVQFTQVEMLEPSPCKVEISCEMPQVEFSPKILEFSKNCRSQEIAVHTWALVGLSEVKLMHIVSE